MGYGTSERVAPRWRSPFVLAAGFVLRQVWSRPRLAWLQPFKLDACGGRRRIRVRQLLQANYDLIVDGFPRSGTSLTAAALGVALPRMRIRSHCHKPTHVLQAVLHHRRPAVVLVRDPKVAVPSAARHYGWNLEEASIRYCAYHRALMPYVDELLIVQFPTATSHLDAVIAGLCRRLGMPSSQPPGTSLLTLASERVRSLPWGASEATVSLPAAVRDAATADCRARFLRSASLVRLTSAAHDDFVLAGACAGALVPP